jgi:hypothetical protein
MPCTCANELSNLSSAGDSGHITRTSCKHWQDDDKENEAMLPSLPPQKKQWLYIERRLTNEKLQNVFQTIERKLVFPEPVGRMAKRDQFCQRLCKPPQFGHHGVHTARAPWGYVGIGHDQPQNWIRKVLGLAQMLRGHPFGKNRVEILKNLRSLIGVLRHQTWHVFTLRPKSRATVSHAPIELD